MRMSAEFLPDWRTCGISISSKDAACIALLNSLYRSQSQYAFFTTIEPLRSSRSSTLPMSNCAYFASRTPRATFSKSQNTARLRDSWFAGRGRLLSARAPLQPGLQPLEVQVDHRRDVQREELRKHQAADHRQAERHARGAAGAEADGDRQAAHERRHGGHHDRPEAGQPGLVDRLLRRQAAALRLDREVDHHDGVLLHDA